MSAPQRVLIVRLSSIGDIVHALPAFVELRRAWPAARFGWAVEAPARELVAALGVDVHDVATSAIRRRPLAPSGLRTIWRLRRELRACRYDLAIDFQGLLKSALVARLSGAPLLGYDRVDAREALAARTYTRTAPPLPPGLHAVERARRLAAFASGQEPAPLSYPAIAGAGDRATVRRFLEQAGIERPLLLHCAANWESKRYPDERWVEAARELHRTTGAPVLWVWGPGEKERAGRLAAAAGEGNRLSCATTLPELVALLEQARLLVGGDSAPLHLAVACGTPVVGLFGPTDPGSLGPLDPADGVVRRVLPCSHCHRRTCPLGTRECLADLPSSMIVRAATARLELAADS